MKLISLKFPHAFLSALLLITASLFCINSMAIGVDADDFIEEASAKNIAAIEAGKLALEKSALPEVKAFARKMIEEKSNANKDLRALASEKNVEMASDAELLAQAKNYVLKQREDESFDASYINNQIDAHKAAIKLFNKASSSTDEDVRQLAATSLPRLEQHLRDAEALVEVVARANKDLDEKLEYSN
jgi:putative membrane protein